jgi:26S proteasome regulatory subunit N8
VQNNSELAHAMSVKTNDQLMAIYLSSLIRAITAFHDLIENKIQNRQQQEEKEAKQDELKDEKVKKTNGVNGVNGEVKETKDAEKESENKDKKK